MAAYDPSMSPDRLNVRPFIMSRFSSIVRFVLPVIVACLLMATSCSQDPEPKAARTETGTGLNLLLITIDTLRADHLGSYGYGQDTSPAIDALAHRGTLFEQAMAPRGITWPSLASLMTSRHPVEHGVRMNGVMLSESETTLAEILEERGYVTNSLLARSTYYQLHEGFPRTAPGDDRELAARASEWLARDHEAPFFLWLHLFGPHKPYAPPSEYEERFSPDYSGPYRGETEYIEAIVHHQKELSKTDLDHLIALYDASIAYTDDLVAGVLDTLAEQGLGDSTLVILGSDHGEDLYDHNKYFFHKASVYDSVLHVPLIFSLPGTVPEGMRVAPVVEQIDIAPTILELLGYPVAPTFEGRSLAPHWRGERVEAKPAFSEWRDAIVSVRTERFRYVLNPTNTHPRVLWAKGEERMKNAAFYQEMIASGELDANVSVYEYPIAEIELYDLSQDRFAPVGNRDSYSTEIAELNRLVVEWQKATGWELSGGIRKDVDPEVQEELEALGYIF